MGILDPTPAPPTSGDLADDASLLQAFLRSPEYSTASDDKLVIDNLDGCSIYLGRLRALARNVYEIGRWKSAQEPKDAPSQGMGRVETH